MITKFARLEFEHFTKPSKSGFLRVHQILNIYFFLKGVKMLFLDPSKPIATCVSETCNGCPVSETLHCHFSLRDLIYFLLIALPSFLVGGAGIYHRNGWMLILWLIMVVGYFGFIEIRVM